jgi:hypothetical protein
MALTLLGPTVYRVISLFKEGFGLYRKTPKFQGDLLNSLTLGSTTLQTKWTYYSRLVGIDFTRGDGIRYFWVLKLIV